MQKIIKAIIPCVSGLCLLLFHLSANAGFRAINASAPPPVTAVYHSFVRKQILYMQHLKRCQPVTVKMSNPLQPTIIITKDVLGRAGRYCRTHKIIGNRGPRDDERPYAVYCYYSPQEITIMTSPKAFRYIQSLAVRNHKHHDLALESPEMLKIEKTACKEYPAPPMLRNRVVGPRRIIK